MAKRRLLAASNWASNFGTCERPRRLHRLAAVGGAAALGHEFRSVVEVREAGGPQTLATEGRKGVEASLADVGVVGVEANATGGRNELWALPVAAREDAYTRAASVSGPRLSWSCLGATTSLPGCDNNCLDRSYWLATLGPKRAQRRRSPAPPVRVASKHDNGAEGWGLGPPPWRMHQDYVLRLDGPSNVGCARRGLATSTASALKRWPCEQGVRGRPCAWGSTRPLSWPPRHVRAYLRDVQAARVSRALQFL